MIYLWLQNWSIGFVCVMEKRQDGESVVVITKILVSHLFKKVSLAYSCLTRCV